MPLYSYRCPKCGKEEEVILYDLSVSVGCNECKVLMERLFPSNQMIKMKGEGGLPSRRKQIFNTTMRKHPKLG